MPHDEKQLLDRLARVEGQVRGVRRMLEEDRHCEDVLTQLAAARSGLEQAGLLLLDQHLVNCIVADDTVSDETVERLRQTLRLWGRH